MSNLVDISNTIFVFGSNLDGIHGAGAALYAHKQRGAVWGHGEGLTGTCYALPTKGHKICYMSENEVQARCQRFLRFASGNPGATFQVTQVGCGLGGFTKQQIAPFFEYAPENCLFDTEWKEFLPDTARFWGTF